MGRAEGEAESRHEAAEEGFRAAVLGARHHLQHAHRDPRRKPQRRTWCAGTVIPAPTLPSGTTTEGRGRQTAQSESPTHPRGILSGPHST
jgi:hypothetical protein